MHTFVNVTYTYMEQHNKVLISYVEGEQHNKEMEMRK